MTTRTKRRACDRKIRHTTRQDAQDHRRRLIADGAHPDWLEVYECRFGDHFHVGHRPGRRR